jgi:hypothetical protein
MNVVKTVKNIRESLMLSLGYFEPKELEILLLTSLKTTLRATWLMTKYFFWLFLPGVYMELIVGGDSDFGRLWEYITPVALTPGMTGKIFATISLLLTFFIILSVRASLKAKQASYYTGFLSRIILFAALFLILPHLFLIPVFWFATFFFFDGSHSIGNWLRSLYNSLILTLGYAPFIAFIGVFHGVIYRLHNFVWALVSVGEYQAFVFLAKYLLSVVIYIFFVAMLGNFYLRVKHGNSKLFLKASAGEGSAAAAKPAKRSMKKAPARKKKA